MKAVIVLGLLLTAPLVAIASDTAYSALRIIGKRDGQESLNRVIELRGRSGMPQPAAWKVIIDEPRARGGVREIEVQRGKVSAERTPTTRSPGAPMNFNQLNLDSEGAFTVANQEAQKAGVPFDHVDYLLRSGTGGGAPVWTLELFDGKNGRMGFIEIAADSGSVLQRQFNRTPRGPAQDDHAYLDERGGPPPRSRGDDDRFSRPGEPFRSVSDFFHRVGKRFEKRSHQLENFVTGKGGRDSDR